MFIKKLHSILDDDTYNKLLSAYHNSVRLSRKLSSPMRALPNFIIAGAQKSGTTSLFWYLASHPNVMGIYSTLPNGQTTWGKEIHYFNDHFEN